MNEDSLDIMAVRRALLALFALTLTAMPTHAHHSFAAQFDAEQPVAFEGVVTKIDWMNPHVYFYIDVRNPDTDEIENWGFEMGPPHQLQRRNWKRNSMQIGDVVSVEGSRARDGSLLANARRVTLADGTVLGAASSEAQTIGRQ